MEEKRNYRIMVFSWNTESVGLCESNDKNVIANNRAGYSSWIPGVKWYECNPPTFFQNFSKLVEHFLPDIIVIGFQEDRIPGSYFHSHFLKAEMPKIGYGLVKRTKHMGVGVTSYRGAISGDPYLRGLRLSVYAKANIVSIISKYESEIFIVLVYCKYLFL